jgi:hypothetical protein
MSTAQSRLPFARPHSCSCATCDCDVQVHSSRHVCRACRNGGHDLRSMLQIRAASFAANDATAPAPTAAA